MTKPRLRIPRRFAGLLAFVLLFAAPAAAGDLIRSKVDPTQRVSLQGHQPPWARAEADLGPARDVPARIRMSLALKRSAERQAAWKETLRELYDPASPRYQQWLGAREIGARFGASQGDIETLSEWLREQGFRVEGVANSRLRIHFSGSQASIARAFGTPLHDFRTGEGKRSANASAPQIPAAFADVVAGITGLSHVRFRPSLRLGARASAAARPGMPLATLCQNPDRCDHIMFPDDFASVYNVHPLHARNLDGGGQSIGIIARANINNNDVKYFMERADLPYTRPDVIVPEAGTKPAPPFTTCHEDRPPRCDDLPIEPMMDQLEATLDVQRAASVAPGAKIKLITSGTAGNVDGVWIAMDHAVDADPVPAQIISISYGLCEADVDSSVSAIFDDYFAQAAMEGISSFVSSGDAGVAGCSGPGATPLPNERSSINLLCASSYVTCVGGTEYADEDDPDRWWSRDNGPGYGSARGYIPEGAWNEPLDRDGAPRMAATGGGSSVWVARPNWQEGIGVPEGDKRHTPDLSLNASIGTGYFTCFAALGSTCKIKDGSFNFMMMGGTSASAPSMAGIAALLNQKIGEPQANLNPVLYQLAADPANGVFHDVTLASSGVSSCSERTPSPCNNATPGPNGIDGGLKGYRIGTGYDLATGLGSIDAERLVDRWQAATPERVNLDQRGLSGAWANPATDGQGLVLEVFPQLFGERLGLLFGGWFSYDADDAGEPRWYTIQGQVGDAAPSAAMPIYQSTGGRFHSPNAATLREVGQATIAFDTCGKGSLSYVFHDGSARSGTIPLTRLLAGQGCSHDGGGSESGASFWRGTWADPQDDQQGLVLDVDGSTVFAAWYTFARNSGSGSGPAGQRWYTLQAVTPASGRRVEQIGIYETRGGRFDRPHATNTEQVGSARLEFQSCAEASLSYSFSEGDNAGLSGQLALARVGPAPAGCMP